MPGKLSRNAFLRVVGLGALVVMLVGMACAPAAPSPTAAPPKPAAPAPTAAPAAPAPTTAPAAPAPTAAPAAAPTAAPAAKPTEAAAAKPAAAAPTGRLVVAVGAWGTETPFFWNGAQTEKVLWAEIYDPLIMRDPKTFEHKPGLALEWKPSADYKSWTIKLRQGVQFHENWGELTSEDVKWTVEQIRRPETTGAEAPFVRTMLDTIEAPDKYTVVFNFKNPTWDLPPRIAQFTGYLNVSSKKYVTSVGEQKAGLNPIGTGPYRHVEGKQGSEHRFEAVANHWRVTPAYKELVIRRVPDVATRLAGLRSGEIDIGQVFGDYMKQAKSANLRIHEVPASAEYWVVLPGQSLPELPDYCPKCPWVGEPDAKSQENAKKVRLALNLAVNKQAIVDSLWQGTGATSPFMYWYYPFNKGFDQNWKVPPYDPQKAKQLLAEAGYPNGFEIKVNPMIYTYAQDGPDVMEAIALDWEKIGLKVKRGPEDLGSFLPKLRAGKTGNTAWVYGSPPADEAAIVWQKTVWSKAGFHTVAENPDYDKDLEAIFAQLDTEKRAKQSHDFAQKMYDDYRTVMIGVKSTTWAVTKKVGNWPSLVSIPLETNYEYITP